MTADIVYELTQRKDSPFYAGIDLTGEKKELTIKQGSLAPEVRVLISRNLRKGGTADYEQYLELLIRFFVAVRSLDPEGWGSTEGATFFKARVLRALIRVLSDMIGKTSFDQLTTERMRTMLGRIDKATLSDEAVRKAQGSAGVQDLYEQMRSQVLGDSAA